MPDSLGRSKNGSESICCILNPNSRGGRGGAIAGRLKRALDATFEQWSVVETEYPGHASELAREAVEGGVDIVAAVGGDGTCHEVVNGLFDGRSPRARRVVFAVIPSGTGSDLSRSLRVPSRLEEALWIASTGMTLHADVGYASFTGPNGDQLQRCFINAAGFGANGDVAERANNSGKLGGGRITFLRATLASLFSYSPGEVDVRWGVGEEASGEWSRTLLSAFIMNGLWCGGGMYLGKGGSMHDGRFNLTLLPDMPPAVSAARSWRLYGGTVGVIPGVEQDQPAWVEAKPLAGQEVLLELDGERLGVLPARFEVLPSALQVRGGWLKSPLAPDEDEEWSAGG